MIRILDSRRENFKISKAYEHKVDVINVITAPEIEMLIIFNEDKYKEFKKSGKKPSVFCKEDLKMTGVKAYSFCEGSAENAIMDILLDNNLLIFSREEMLEEEVIHCREGKRFEEKYVRELRYGSI